MPKMSIFKVQHDIIGRAITTTFLLLDEQQQRLLLFQLNETIPVQDTVPAEPLTNDFIADVLTALGGTLEEVSIDTLPNRQIYTRIHLRDQNGLHTVSASLNDALRLVHTKQSLISVSDEILARRAVSVADYGVTQQQRFAEISRLAEQDLDSLRPIAREPLNLNFSDGLRNWQFFRNAEYGSYIPDPHTTFTGKPSLAITLHKPFLKNTVVLSHERFLAERYRHLRVCLSTYVKTEQNRQPSLKLWVSWPSDKTFMGLPAPDSRSTHSRIVPVTGDSSWVHHELVIDVPEQARHISFSLDMREPGKLWLDGLQFTVVDHSIPLTGEA